MGEAFITRRGGSGAANIRVKPFSTLPEFGKENDIAVITVTAVPKWNVSEAEPENPINGEVWIKSDGESNPINVNKKNPLIIYPSVCHQFNGTDWERQEAYIRKNNAWINFSTKKLVIFSASDNPSDIFNVNMSRGATGGSYGLTKNADNARIYCSYGSYAGSIRVSATTKKLLNLRPFSKLYIKSRTNSGVNSVGLTTSPNSIGQFIASVVPTVSSSAADWKEIDISNIDEGYFSAYVTSGDANAREIYLYEVYAE